MDPQTLQNLLLAIIAIEGGVVAFTLLTASVKTGTAGGKNPKPAPSPVPAQMLADTTGTTGGGSKPGPTRPTKAFRVVIDDSDPSGN